MDTRLVPPVHHSSLYILHHSLEGTHRAAVGVVPVQQGTGNADHVHSMNSHHTAEHCHSTVDVQEGNAAGRGTWDHKVVDLHSYLDTSVDTWDHLYNQNAPVVVGSYP